MKLHYRIQSNGCHYRVQRKSFFFWRSIREKVLTGIGYHMEARKFESIEDARQWIEGQLSTRHPGRWRTCDHILYERVS